MKSRRLNFRGDRGGMTLIEGVTGLAILAGALVLIYSGFVVAGKVFKNGDDWQDQTQSNYAELEKGTGEETLKELQLKFGDKTINIDGEYQEAGSDSNATGLISYEVNSISRVPGGVRDSYIYWITKFKTMTSQELNEKGYPVYHSNDTVRNWLSQNQFEGKWPILPESFIKRNKITPPSSPLYIQPYWDAKTGRSGDVFVFAVTSLGGNWYTGYIYNHEERAWYHGPSFSISDHSWAEVKDAMKEKGWKKMH